MRMANEKFAPPPSNIVIRTMEKDLETLKAGGGEFQQAPPAEEEPRAPRTDAFLYQETPAPGIQEAQTMPLPPPIETAHQASASTGQPPDAKKLIVKPLLAAALGIAGLSALGALGYFVLFPFIKTTFLAEAPSPSPSPAEPSPSPSPSPLASPLPTPPAVSLIKPADGTGEFVITAVTPNDLSSAAAAEAAFANAAGTFKIMAVRQDGANDYLEANRVFALLWNSAPQTISSALGNNYALFLYWVSPAEAHIGAYFTLKPEAVEAVKAALIEWEPTLAQNASFFFLGKAPGTTTIPFRDGAYQTFPLRFAVFSSGLAIDHAVIANTLVFTTNRDSMFEAIRRLTGVE